MPRSRVIRASFLAPRGCPGAAAPRLARRPRGEIYVEPRAVNTRMRLAFSPLRRPRLGFLAPRVPGNYARLFLIFWGRGNFRRVPEFIFLAVARAGLWAVERLSDLFGLRLSQSLSAVLGGWNFFSLGHYSRFLLTALGSFQFLSVRSFRLFFCESLCDRYRVY